MDKGLILQNRDIELLEFLASYKTITLDNTKYIYNTKTYQEKRICHLVQEKYLTRLKHKEIALGKKGREFLTEIGTEIKEHCRNTNNLERLKLISDIAAFTKFSNTTNFIPSWELKDKNSPTQDSRRYLGLLSFDSGSYTVYSTYGHENDKYLISIYYDLKKEHDFLKSIIFTNDVEKILYHKKGFGFSDSHLYLIEYNDFSKKIIRNYEKIRACLFSKLSKKHEVEYTDFRHMDFLVDNDYYLKMMLFLDNNQIYYLKYFLKGSSSYRNSMYFICFKKDEKYLKDIIKDCHTLIIDEAEVEEYIGKDYLEIKEVRLYF